MPEPMQLTLDGGEVPVAGPGAPAAAAPLRPAQREILMWIRDHGSIRSSEAGWIVHAHRTPPCRRPTDGIGCCPYASSDGVDAMKRLQARGLVRHGSARGLWVSVAAGEPAAPDVMDALERARQRVARSPTS